MELAALGKTGLKVSRLGAGLYEMGLLADVSVDILERGEVTQALLDARQAGKTRFIGYSGDNKAALWAIENGQFDTLQITFNLVAQRARRDVLPKAKAKRLCTSYTTALTG